MQFGVRNEQYTPHEFGFNGMEKDDDVKGAGNSLDFGARVNDVRLGRWMSLDPYSCKYHSLSGYHAQGNNPILYIDRDGEENIIYLVYVAPKNNKRARLSASQLSEVKKNTERQLENMMLRTKVVVYTGKEPFDPRYIDKTDTFILVGDAKDCVEYAEKNQLGEKALEHPSGKPMHKYTVRHEHIANDPAVLETASSGSGDPSVFGGGVGGIVGADRIGGWAQNVGLSLEESLALAVLHAALGHNTNFVGGDHSTSASTPIAYDACRLSITINPNIRCMGPSGGVMGPSNVSGGRKTVDEFCFESAMDVRFMENVQKRFGIQKASDNYEENKGKIETGSNE